VAEEQRRELRLAELAEGAKEVEGFEGARPMGRVERPIWRELAVRQQEHRHRHRSNHQS
jgi:hypothetical protein